MRISDWSSDVCSSDLLILAGARLDQSDIGRIDHAAFFKVRGAAFRKRHAARVRRLTGNGTAGQQCDGGNGGSGFDFVHDRVLVMGSGRYRTCRSEEHTSELQSLMRISYAVFCLKNK